MRQIERTTDVQRHATFETCEARMVMSAQPLAEWIQETAVVSATTPRTQLADAHALTGLDEAQAAYGFYGSGQTVAVIDSGIAYTHEALGGGFGSQYRVVGGYDFTEERDGDPYDDGPAGAHGTHVAGIIGSDDAVHTGVAPEVDLVALRVFNDQGQSDFAWIENALKWVHTHRNDFENPITTVNLSIGTEVNLKSVPNWAVLEDEFAQLERDGIFISVSAGNAFTQFNSTGLSYPAVSEYVVPVASVDDNGQLSYFSQRDSRVIAAPGRGVMSTVPDYLGNFNGVDDDFLKFSGTSMAAPYVAGASVVLREAYAFLGQENVDQDTIYDLMKSTADTVYDSVTGQYYSRLNMQRAFDTLMPGDDVGGSAATAKNLGSVADTFSVSGMLGRLDDTDAFTFTATASGTMRLSVDADGADPTWQLLAGSTTATQSGGGEFTLQVVAGQSYTIGLSANGELAYYDLQGSIESSATQLGAIDYLALAGQDARQEGLEYSFTAARSGTLTIQSEAALGQNVTLRLYDAGGRLLASATGTRGLQRLDATVSGGQSLVLKVTGTAGDVDLTLANLVSRQGSTLLVYGTNRADNFEVRLGSTQQVEVNGISYSYSASTISRVQIDGRGGQDAAKLVGTSASETVSLRTDGGSLTGSSGTVTLSDVEYLNVYGGGGNDTAYLSGSDGDDEFRAQAQSATLSGSGYSQTVQGFSNVTAYARGGNDISRLYGTSRNENFIGKSNYSRLAGADYSNYAVGFDRVYGYSGGGSDRARLFDGAGNDIFKGTSTASYMTGDDFFNHVSGFEDVTAYSYSGQDIAYLQRGSSSDQVSTGGSYASLRGEGYQRLAVDFARTQAILSQAFQQALAGLSAQSVQMAGEIDRQAAALEHVQRDEVLGELAEAESGQPAESRPGQQAASVAKLDKLLARLDVLNEKLDELSDAFQPGNEDGMLAALDDVLAADELWGEI